MNSKCACVRMAFLRKIRNDRQKNVCNRPHSGGSGEDDIASIRVAEMSGSHLLELEGTIRLFPKHRR